MEELLLYKALYYVSIVPTIAIFHLYICSENIRGAYKDKGIGKLGSPGENSIQLKVCKIHPNPK